MFGAGAHADWNMFGGGDSAPRHLRPAVAATGSGVGRWTRLFTVVGVGFFLLWRVGVLAGVPARTAVDLAVLGFVLHVVFGHAYLLVPAYFQRVDDAGRLPCVHLALTVSGTLLLAASHRADAPDVLGPPGALLWATGVAVFLAELAWTLRGVVRDADPFDGASNAAERVAMAAVPVPLAYLAVGSYDRLAAHTALPSLLAESPAGVTHLFAAGVAALLVFVLGVRLLPRFLGVDPLVAPSVLAVAAGSVGPGLLAASLWGGRLFGVAAAVETLAVVAFAAQAVVLFARSARRRVGSSTILAGLLAGVLAVLLSAGVAVGWLSPARIAVHRAVVLGGFLAVTVAGFLVQFYPPSAGDRRWSDEPVAAAVLGAFLAGVGVEAAGLAAGDSGVVAVGRAVAALAAGGFAVVLGDVVASLASR